MSLWQFLRWELAVPAPTLPQVKVSLSKLSESYAFLLVPLRLERLLCHGFFICLDSFLFFFTLLPLRLLITLFRFLANYRQPSKVFTAEVADDIFRGALLTLVLIMLWFPAWADYSTVYHFIRGESTLKLYVVFNVLDVFDKLCCAFGQDVLDAVLFAFLYTDLRRPWCCLAFLAAACYVFGHAWIIFVQLVTLNVALNSQNNALFTLLVSNNFVELKGNVFKRCGKENLFQISCSDIVERFQISMYISILLVQNLRGTQFGGAQMAHIVMVYGCEVLTDYIKHAFIMKFNNLDPNLYYKFEQIICCDVLESRTAEQRHSVLGQWMNGEGPPVRPTVSRRIGLVVIPSVALFSRACFEALPDILPFRHNMLFTVAVLLLGYGILVMLKIFTGILTTGHSCKMYLRTMKNTASATVEPNTRGTSSLVVSPAATESRKHKANGWNPSALQSAASLEGTVSASRETSTIRSVHSPAHRPQRSPLHGKGLPEVPAGGLQRSFSSGADRPPSADTDIKWAVTGSDITGNPQSSKNPSVLSHSDDDGDHMQHNVAPAHQKKQRAITVETVQDIGSLMSLDPACFRKVPSAEDELDNTSKNQGDARPPIYPKQSQKKAVEPSKPDHGHHSTLFPRSQWLDPEQISPRKSEYGSQFKVHGQDEPKVRSPPAGTGQTKTSKELERQDSPDDDFACLAAVHRYGMIGKRIIS